MARDGSQKVEKEARMKRGDLSYMKGGSSLCSDRARVDFQKVEREAKNEKEGFLEVGQNNAKRLLPT